MRMQIQMNVGFRIVKPASWQFISAQENLEHLKHANMQDAELKEALVKYSTAPLVAIMKYPEPYEDVNPTFKVDIKPLGQFKGLDAKEILSRLLPTLQNAFKDFVIVQPPTDVQVSGLHGAYARATYSFETPEAGPFPTSSELWIVPRGDYFFIFGAGTRTDEKTGSRREIQEIIETIHIESQ